MRSLQQLRTSRGAKGLACVVALVFLIIFSSLAVAFTSTAFLELRKSDNCTEGISAQLSAESGLSYIQYVLRDMRVPPDANGAALMNAIQQHLSTKLATNTVQPPVAVTCAGNTVSVSALVVTGLSFSYQFNLASSANPPSCDVIVTGRNGAAVRRLMVRLMCVPKRSAVFDYGVASRGKIAINGSAVLAGINLPKEASILSTREEPVAIEAGGHATISGNLFVTGEDLSYVLISGSVSIGGSTDIQDILTNHVNVGTEEPDFPAVDTTPYASMATSVVDSSTDLTGTNHVFDNVVIRAGTNPTFRSNAVINGIMYVEAPNKVTFNASTQVNGIIATQDGSSQALGDCQIEFRGQSSAPGVDALPSTSQFAAIKRHKGTVILAPGFGVTFRGATNSINGVIAADQLSFIGNTDIAGQLTGAIVGLKDREMTLSGNVDIRIQRPPDTILPAGFRHSMGLAVQADSYTELTGP